MGASISHRQRKCLKTRRAKSEEYLGSKRNCRISMGRFFAPWHNIITENIASNNQENVNATRYFNYSDWLNKEFSSSMEKSFNEIHRSNSLDKNDYETDYEKLVIDNFSNNCIITDEEDSLNEKCRGRLTIDVNKDSIFEVSLHKGSRGLGFSVLEYDGFIFIKQLFPLETASQSGMLQEGDIILSANGNALTDLSSFEALQILRTLENPVTLIVCRLQQFLNKKPVTSSQTFTNFNSNTQSICDKEFEIEMKKINGSLGFTLKKDEDGDCNHMVRALVKEPAISDGRIKPGDQIISVNDQEIGKMNHQEAVKFLRDCDDVVRLKLRRDTMSSSLTSLNSSHLEINNKTLRKEALEMLNDLAVKKLKNESEDRQNNNKCKKNSRVLGSDDNIGGALKKRDSLFDSRENLSAFQPSDGDRYLTSHPLHDNTLVTNNLGELADEPVSLPTLDVTTDKISFHHNDPAYHSINVPHLTAKVYPKSDLTTNLEDKFSHNRSSPTPSAELNKGLLKWKGIVLDTDCENKLDKISENYSTEMVTVQLQKNWNSRLGFSLSSQNTESVISAIYEDSIAAKDGRLKVNDKIVEVNGKNVEKLETNEIIELLRTVRGTVVLTVLRNLF